MIVQDINDKWLIFKEIVRLKIINIQILKKYPVVEKIIKLFEIKNIQKIIKGYPETILIITKDKVIRIPLDKLSLERCMVNKEMLMALTKTSIASFVPKFLNEVRLDGKIIFYETKLPGFALESPVSRMEQLILEAADFITHFQKETAKDITIEAEIFRRLIGSDFERLSFYLDSSSKRKLVQIEQKLQQQLLGKKFKSVWFHGDFKISNILFGVKDWRLKGIIDWDLSIKEGFPLLDIFFLLISKENIMSRENIASIFKKRFLTSQFSSLEKKIIKKYLYEMKLSKEVISPLLIVFWVNHLCRRHQQSFVINNPNREKWLKESVYEVIDNIYSLSK